MSGARTGKLKAEERSTARGGGMGVCAAAVKCERKSKAVEKKLFILLRIAEY